MPRPRIEAIVGGLCNYPAGKDLLERTRRQTFEAMRRVRKAARKLLGPFKGPMMALLRRLLGTQIPLPAWMHSRVLNHYAARNVLGK